MAKMPQRTGTNSPPEDSFFSRIPQPRLPEELLRTFLGLLAISLAVAYAIQAATWTRSRAAVRQSPNMQRVARGTHTPDRVPAEDALKAKGAGESPRISSVTSRSQAEVAAGGRFQCLCGTDVALDEGGKSSVSGLHRDPVEANAGGPPTPEAE